MDSFNWLIKGIVLGFSIAAPVGPIGLLCIRRTLTQGRLHGFVSGLGAATADGCYGFLAAFGLTILTNALIHQQTLIRLVGGVFLIYLAVHIFFSPPAKPSPGVDKTGLPGAFFSTLLLTLSNPMTILSFTAIFAGLGFSAQAADFSGSLALVIGVFFGSALWWLSLSLMVGIVRTRITNGLMIWINRVSGVLIAGFGLAALISIAVK
jgi:threonine/homoserine/homoserine lactone efflux protein